MRPIRWILLIVAAVYGIVLASGLGVFDGAPGPSNAFAYEYSTTITTSTTTSTSTSTSTTSTATKPGKGCGDKNHLHDRRFECKVTISGLLKKEGNSGTTTFSFGLKLSALADSPVTVDFTTANGTAIAPGDYTATNGTATFPTGTSTASINVTVIGDTVREPNETFYVTLSNPSPNAYLGNSQGTGAILNDD
jgi:Calx-beta domain